MNPNTLKIIFAFSLLHCDTFGALLKRSPSALGDDELSKIFECSTSTSDDLPFRGLSLEGDSFKVGRGSIKATCLHQDDGWGNAVMNFTNRSHLYGKDVHVRYKTDPSGQFVYQRTNVPAEREKRLTIPKTHYELQWYACER